MSLLSDSGVYVSDEKHGQKQHNKTESEGHFLIYRYECGCRGYACEIWISRMIRRVRTVK